MKNPNLHAARILVATASTVDRSVIVPLLREHGLLVDRTLDRTWRGSGNAAARRQGIDTTPQGCDCVVCVVYGGDCAYQMSREWVGENHRSKRGVKTKGH